MTARYPQSAPVRRADHLRTLDGIDARVESMARSFGACEVRYPALIARHVLDQAEYPQAFPHLLMSARPTVGLDDGEPAPWCLSPAVCYHAYAQLAGHVLAAPVAITARGRCFRVERESEPGIRQIEFEMRELVLVGPGTWVDASAEAGRIAVEAIACQMDLSGRWQAAEDPFFLPAAAGKALMQRLLKVKVEYQCPGPGGLALASVNRHGTFFGQRFDISTPDGRPAHSACIAVGLDRWAHLAHRAVPVCDQEVQP